MGIPFEQIKIGDNASLSKTMSETDVYLYAGISGDFNPVHINKEAAAGSIFKERIAHGMLTAGLISAVIGCKLPGEGTIYLGQNLKFTAPVRIGDTVTAIVEVIGRKEDKRRLTLKTTCFNQLGEIVIEGEALVKCG
ncbi:MaoC family dehydratase [Desulfoscipio sp. XC116]|uniref:MaoC family dehydratase n=1 Tax=Desulfoscipio sp. XC116 TaxID=3144975 RepID=UPI00325B0C35